MSDQLQSIAAAIGAATAIAALLVSGAALHLAMTNSRTAAIVVHWRAGGRLELENRGPADARQVVLRLEAMRQATDDETAGWAEVAHLDAGVVPAGFIRDAPAHRLLGQEQHRAHLSWRDGRRGEREVTVTLQQERRPPQQLPLSDAQVKAIAQALGVGVGEAVRDSIDRNAAAGWRARQGRGGL